MCERKTAACFGDLRAVRQAEDLKAAAVGQNRAVPAHELVQSAQSADQLVAGPQGQMVGVAEHHLGAGLRASC